MSKKDYGQGKCPIRGENRCYIKKGSVKCVFDGIGKGVVYKELSQKTIADQYCH